MRVYVSLNKASLKGNTACTMETGVAMERVLFSRWQKKWGFDSLFLTCLRKKYINLCNYWHQQIYSWKRQREQTDLIRSQWRISGIRSVVMCTALHFSGQLSSYPLHHTQLCSQPLSGTLVTYPSKLCRSQSHNKPQESGFAKLLFFTGSILMQKVPESSTCQIFPFLE